MSEPVKEVIVCKFDDNIECSHYNCEEDVSTIEMYEYACPLAKKKIELEDALDESKNETEIWKRNRNIYVEKKNKLCQKLQTITTIINQFKPEWADHLENEFGQEGYDLREWRNKVRDAILGKQEKPTETKE